MESNGEKANGLEKFKLRTRGLGYGAAMAGPLNQNPKKRRLI
jgi:hypothetical protein